MQALGDGSIIVSESLIYFAVSFPLRYGGRHTRLFPFV